ncbi:MAG: DUF4093 domain-containing protein [Clostridia bacterium]|nr:DUF4093 domain-containing protein [Clostridia bacterium]
MTPIKIREAIVVEGRYDAARLRSVVDTTVVETGGFSLFRDRETVTLLRKLAAARGLIVLTDSDAAGFVIRDHISGCLPKEHVKHAYVPEIAGKERRKPKPSAEGLLGVEGIDGEIIVEALLRAGATVEGENGYVVPPPFLTKARLYEDGLVGRENSAVLREALLCALGLPHRLSTNRLIEAVNALCSEEDYQRLLQTLR